MMYALGVLEPLVHALRKVINNLPVVAGARDARPACPCSLCCIRRSSSHF